MRKRPRLALTSATLALGSALLALTGALAGEARAAGEVKEVSVAAASGLRPLRVTVDPAHRALRVSVGGVESDVAIDLPVAELGGAAEATAETIAIGEGKQIVHVRVPSRTRSDVAWEAVLAGQSPAPVWSGVTGYAGGEAGERAGEALEISPPREEGTERVVVVGEVREDLRICGQARTLLGPRVLDPRSLTFRGATMHRLPLEQREEAERVIAAAHGGPADTPLARLLLATGASTALGAPSALTDGDPASTWSEGRPSDGHGEFVVMRTTTEVPMTRLAIAIAPPRPSAHGAAPRTFFLVTEDRTISVTLPEDAWMHPGAAYDLPLVEPIRASCLALVLDKAYERSAEPHPEVTVAELTAYSAFDGPAATLDQVAKALGGGGARSDAAKAVLERAGDAGLAAAATAYPSLDAPGRALAVDAAIGAGTCEASAPLLLAAMTDKDREVARKGREKVERCGKRAVPALLAALRGRDDALRATAATLAAAVSPSEALEPLVAALGSGGPAARGAVRSGVAKAARGASKEKLAALVRAARAPEAEIDLLRALEDALPSIAAEGDAAIATLEAGAPPMGTRYLLLGPIASLARAGDGVATAHLTAVIAADPDPAVRAHAAGLAAGVAGASAALSRAVDTDASPRVREAALEALASAKPPPPVASITRRLASDEWTFVRSAAASALAAFAPGPQVDEALEAALGDPSAPVREAVVTALAAHGDAHAVKGIRGRIEDEHEALEVRLAATRAIATLCDRGSIDLLQRLASRAPLPMASDEEIQLGFAAAEALGRVHPADLADRLAPLAAKDARVEARTAAARALATPPGCR